MRLTAETIATTALDLLDEVGLDGLTMRRLAQRLDVKAPALYWHVRNKRELLDAMAGIIHADAVAGVGPPADGQSCGEWLADLVRRQRRALLRHRDGGRVYGGTRVTDPALYRTIELTLGVLAEHGIAADAGTRLVSTLLYYTTGFVVEEQARTGVDYDDNPYRPDRLAAHIDPDAHPRTARALPYLLADPDGAFEDGLRLILTGAGLPPDPPG